MSRMPVQCTDAETQYPKYPMGTFIRNFICNNSCLINTAYECTCLIDHKLHKNLELLLLSSHLKIAKIMLLIRELSALIWHLYVSAHTGYEQLTDTVGDIVIQVRTQSPTWLRLSPSHNHHHKWCWHTELLMFSQDMGISGSSASNGNLIALDHS